MNKTYRAYALLLALISPSAAFSQSDEQTSQQVDLALQKAKAKEDARIAEESNLSPIKTEIKGELLGGYNSLSKKPEVLALDFGFQVKFGSRVRADLELDGRGVLAKEIVKDNLEQSPQLRASITSALQTAIAAHFGIPPQFVTVPPALVDQTVKQYIEATITNKAVESVSVPVISISAEVIQSDEGNVTVTAGKIRPVYYQKEAYGHFATSTPAIQVEYQYHDWTVYATAYNSRLGENWNINGEANAEIQSLLENSGNKVLDYSLNSHEVAIEKMATSIGNVIVALGQRENFNNSKDQSKYVLVQIDDQFKTFRVSTTASVESFQKNSVVAPDGTRYRLTVLLSRKLSEKLTAYLQAYYGKQTGGLKTEQQAAIVGLERTVLITKRTASGLRGSLFATKDTQSGVKQHNNGVFLGFVVRVN